MITSRGPSFVTFDAIDDAVFDAVFGALRPKMKVGLGGVLDRRRPIALCRSLVASGIDGVDVSSFLAGPETEVLAEAGAISSLTTGYIDPRAAARSTMIGVATGRIERREMSEHLFVAGLLAAGSGLPFWPTKGAAGSDVLATLGFRDVECPYTGTHVTAVPATPLDLALLHADAVTSDGAVLFPNEPEFIDDADATLARAARRVVVSTPRIVDGSTVPSRSIALAPFEVDVIVHDDGADVA